MLECFLAGDGSASSEQDTSPNAQHALCEEQFKQEIAAFKRMPLTEEEVTLTEWVIDRP
ncbi:MAG: hypothetical protein SPI77_06140 [Corynebacterium sp.]|nr:hypothetical protein [Corynebacterium sp.]